MLFLYRPTKVESMDKKSGNAARTALGPKSDVRVEKGKEVGVRTSLNFGKYSLFLVFF